MATAGRSVCGSGGTLRGGDAATGPPILPGIASPLAFAGRRWPSMGRWTRLATGALSVAFGVWLVYQIGWRDGLFVIRG